FRVDAEGKSNVYLRSWIATGYNWDENLWQSATFDDIYKYRETMEKGFTPDSIKTAFYSYVYPSSTIIEDENTYKNFTKFGFTVQQVDVWRVRGSGLLLFIPAHMNTDVGLLDYGKMSPAPYKHQSYYEGVYSSLFYRYGRGYGTVSYITAYNRADSAESIERSLLYYNMCADAILAAPDAVGDEAGAIVYSLEQYFSENGIEYLGASSIADRYYFSMTDDEKKAFINSVKAERSYRDFVYETYTQKAENEAISLIAGEIKDAALSAEAENGGDSVLSPHEAVLSVIDYFKTNDFTYTETPNGTLAKGNKPVIESFLTDVKQGYCSHFASSAVFLLREMGFAVRYVEGYVATDFETMGLEGSKTRSDVEGTDAHAWIEVYVEGMGWMQYEVTPGQLADDMYDPNSDTIDPALTEPWEDQGSVEDDENVTPPDFVDDEEEEQLEESLQNRPHTSDEEQVEEDVSDLVLLFRIIVILLIALAVGLIVFLIIKLIRKRAWEAMNARYKVIDSAKNRDTFLEKDFDRHECANKLTDWIMEVFALIGCEPRQGELPSEFVLRMREDYGDLSKVDIEDVIYAIQKEEFGHGLKFDEQNALAEYLEDIISSVYAGMNPWQKLINRYFRRKI
ncbi:MAG: hypothetical protein IJD22_05025, partial [Clostridia bacterium]|nr:hypothetical protein [Clostridia bacterium]